MSIDKETKTFNMAASVEQTIFTLLSQKDLRHRIGHFAGSGTIDIAPSNTPKVNIAGFGFLGLPLSSQQATALIAEMQQAPFGKGLDTIVDINVRRAWQLGTERVSLNPHWTFEALPGVVNNACEQLGLDAAALGVQAHFYKLLCYEAGGHFKTHRDTEKEPGMFATLIVQLPSQHQGGDLVVQHRGEQMRIGFAAGSEYATQYAVFYADCEHTLEPVTEGVRLVLAYNLVRTKADQGLYPMVGEQQASRGLLTNAIRAWSNSIRQSEAVVMDEDRRRMYSFPPTPKKLVYLLEHKYTNTSLSFDGLKGEDRMLLRALRGLNETTTDASGTACVEPLLDVYLCLIERHFSDPEAGEDSHHDYEETISIPLWLSETGNKIKFSSLDIKWDTEVLGRQKPYGEMYREEGDDFGVCELSYGRRYPSKKGQTRKLKKDLLSWDDRADHREQIGYTGNDGYTSDTWYYTAAIVFWPRSQAFRMVREAGSLMRLAELVEDAVARGAPYGETYLTALIDILCEEKGAPVTTEVISTALIDILCEEKTAPVTTEVISTIFKCISHSADDLFRAVKALGGCEICHPLDPKLIVDIVDTFVRVTCWHLQVAPSHDDPIVISIGKDEKKEEEALAGCFVAAITELLRSKETVQSSASIVLGIQMEANKRKVTATATTPQFVLAVPVSAQAVSSVDQFLSSVANRLSTLITDYIEHHVSELDALLVNVPQEEEPSECLLLSLALEEKRQPLPSSLLPFLASFDSGIPVLESVAESVNKGDKELPFSQYATIAGIILGSPRQPPMLPMGHSALATILSSCAAALGREASPNAPDVAWMFWALLQLSMQHPEYRRALDALADTIQANPKSKALLKPLLANADVQEAVRCGDDGTCRRLCELRVQQLVDSPSSHEPSPLLSAGGLSLAVPDELEMLQQLL